MVKDLIAALSADVDSQIAALQTKKQGFVDLQTQIDAESKAASDASYDQGVKDNQAAVGNSAGKIYSLEEANALIAESVDPLKAQMSDLQAKYDALAAVPPVDVSKAVADAVAAEQLRIGGLIRDAEVDNEALADKLAPKA